MWTKRKNAISAIAEKFICINLTHPLVETVENEWRNNFIKINTNDASTVPLVQELMQCGRVLRFKVGESVYGGNSPPSVPSDCTPWGIPCATELDARA